MRFAKALTRLGPRKSRVKFTPILVAQPSDKTEMGLTSTPRGLTSIREAKGREEALMWSVERPDGGRGFGFTGGHFRKAGRTMSFVSLF